MSQPTAAPGRPPAGAEVSVPIGAIIQALQERYGRLISDLLRENAELQAGVEAQAQELAYHRSLAAAREEQEAAQEPPARPGGPEVPGALG